MLWIKKNRRSTSVSQPTAASQRQQMANKHRDSRTKQTTGFTRTYHLSWERIICSSRPRVRLQMAPSRFKLIAAVSASSSLDSSNWLRPSSQQLAAEVGEGWKVVVLRSFVRRDPAPVLLLLLCLLLKFAVDLNIRSSRTFFSSSSYLLLFCCWRASFVVYEDDEVTCCWLCENCRRRFLIFSSSSSI